MLKNELAGYFSEWMNYSIDMKYIFKLLICISIIGHIQAKESIIKMATLAPEGTDWHGQLVELGQQWKKVTDGQVILRIYPGGVVGDERDMIRKIRIGQLHAAAVSTEGLSEINPAVRAFSIPLLFDDYNDVDWLRMKMSEALEMEIRANGFELLMWMDIGWVKWFTKTPIVLIDDLKAMRIFTWAGDYSVAKIWENAGFQVVPLASIDIMSGMQTGLIDAISTTPLYALSRQLFTAAPYMLDINWGVLSAGLVIDKRKWDQILPVHQEKMRQVALEIGRKHQQTTRFKDVEAIAAMEEYGLQVYTPTIDEREYWKNYVQPWYSLIRSSYVSENVFDQVIEYMAEKDSLDAMK